MNTLETLYFPDTAITSDRQFPLFLLFSTVHYIQPVEPDAKSEKRSMDTFMDRQFCQAHTPHPLGKDRDRFLYLVNDIQNRKDDYATQLSHIALASMSKTRSDDGNTKQDIMSSILGRSSNTDALTATEELEVLWKARLVLKIAEILDREEEEVAEALVMLEENESNLFARLQGQDEDGETENLYEELTKIKTKLGKPRTESIRNRVKAWFRLIKDTELPHCPVWTTSRQEAADIFFENFEKKNRSNPTLIAELELPSSTGRNGEKVIEKQAAFSSDASAHLNIFYQKLTSATEDISSDKDFCSFSSNWQQLLNLHFPAAKFGRATIQFYYFKDCLTNFTGNTADQTKDGAHLLAVFAS